MEDIFLNDCWMLYFHDPDNEDWGVSSYHRLHTISTVRDWVDAHTAFQSLWQQGMFFLMREHVQPTWEDACNRDGGCLSFKVNKPDAGEYWFQLGCKLLGEVLSKHPEQSEKINGISISPKRNYCILRIWLRTHDVNNPDIYHLQAPYYSQVMYKPHSGQKGYESKT